MIVNQQKNNKYYSNKIIEEHITYRITILWEILPPKMELL